MIEQNPISYQKHNQNNLLRKLPLEVFTIFKIFSDKIRLVGGSVRDLLIEKKVIDYDFACELLPNDIIKILKKNKIKAIPTGVKYGTITAVINNKNFEITTLRSDKNQNGRYCDVDFISDYEQDALRRDFTINSLYLDELGVIHDYCNGFNDLKNNIVRFIGDSESRIKEDYLRILRFFRFSCSYSSSIDNSGLKACIKYKNNLTKISKERIRSELFKIIENENLDNLYKILYTINHNMILEPIISAKLNLDSFRRIKIIEKKLSIKTSLILRIAILLISKSTHIQTIFKEIVATKKEKSLLNEIKNLSDSFNLDKLLHYLVFFDKKIISEALLYKIIVLDYDIDYSLLKEKLYFINNFTVPEFPLSGHDIKKLGYKNVQIKKAILEAKNFWIENDFKKNKQELIEYLKAI
jgi:poly(A) polymerase